MYPHEYRECMFCGAILTHDEKDEYCMPMSQCRHKLYEGIMPFQRREIIEYLNQNQENQDEIEN